MMLKRLKRRILYKFGLVYYMNKDMAPHLQKFWDRFGKALFLLPMLSSQVFETVQR
jgi:hypothetical protein